MNDKDTVQDGAWGYNREFEYYPFIIFFCLILLRFVIGLRKILAAVRGCWRRISLRGYCDRDHRE
jgi:hypothetical protein